MEYTFYNDIYSPIKQLPSTDFDFYDYYHRYLLLCKERKKNCKDDSYKTTDEFKEVIKNLNEKYSKIKNLDQESTNWFGEYDYPKAAYKIIGEEKEKFVCISDKGMHTSVDFRKILQYIALYGSDSIKLKKNERHPNENLILMETDVKSLMAGFSSRYSIFKKNGMLTALEEIVVPIIEKNIPEDSLCFLDLRNVFLQPDIEGFLKDFKS